MLERLTLQHFATSIGVDFRIDGSEGLTLVLREARASDASRRSGAKGSADAVPREPFELMFEGPNSPILPQKIYRLESASMEPLEIFIVPIGPYQSGIGYQAIFN